MVKDALLSCNSNVLGPLHETRQVALRLDVPSETEVASRLLEEGASSAGATSRALGLDDLLSLSFLHL